MKFLFAVVALICVPVLSMAVDVIVESPQGRLLGETVGPDSSEKVFKGIPYALPPVGTRRWRSPEPFPKWEGIRLARQFGPLCEQVGMPYPMGDGRPLQTQTSEDCLTLNIWTSAKKGEKRPVMVWIHGGGFLAGGGSVPFYDGVALTQQGVVVVTFNYRLGVFGYFAHPELTAESPHKASGNYGTQDQIAALKWVHDNIAAFGGDPDNVTVFGHSAGSMSVGQLLATPLSEGLFHRAIAMSTAPAFPLRELDKAAFGTVSAHEVGLRFARLAGAPNLSALRAMPAEDLLRVAAKAGLMPEGVNDGWVFPEQFYRLFAQKKLRNVPLMLGFVEDEVPSAAENLDASIPASVVSYKEKVHALYSDMADQYLKLYPSTDLRKAIYSATGDAVVNWSMLALANASPGPVYFYKYSHLLPALRKTGGIKGQWYGVFHGAELRNVFNNLERPFLDADEVFNTPPQQQDYDMAKIITGYWTSFARDGLPHIKDKPKWPRYESKTRRYMNFKGGVAMAQENLRPGIFEFYDQYYTHIRAQGGTLWNYWLGGGLRKAELSHELYDPKVE